jgi:predicted GNAT superfamily acetyltransferase
VTPETLGFHGIGHGAWRRSVRGQEIEFRLLTELDELAPLEALQREVMGASDLDIFPASGMIVVPETGGHVLGAYIEGELAGAVYGFGGFVDGTPRIASDWMGVRPQFRSAGLGTELKKLQAAVALADGFREIVWTVDPLRAANARLNFERLGAYCDHYEENRYGASYATGLYGGLPTDRLHMTWPIADPAVEARLTGQIPLRTAADVLHLEHYDPKVPATEALIYLPNDIDAILQMDLNAVLRWRLLLRETIQQAFEDGFVIRGFVSGVAAGGELCAYVIDRREKEST